MEPSGRNQWQLLANGATQKAPKQADPQPLATHGNRLGAHGKEGVDGSSPSEGLKSLEISYFCCPFGRGVGAEYGGGHHVRDLQAFPVQPRRIEHHRGTLREQRSRWIARKPEGSTPAA
jgi:hypothetical protein